MGGVSPSSPALLQIKSQTFAWSSDRQKKELSKHSKASKMPPSPEASLDAVAKGTMVVRPLNHVCLSEEGTSSSPARGTWQQSWGRGLSPQQTLMLSSLLQPIIKDQNSNAPLTRMRTDAILRLRLQEELCCVCAR